MWIIGHRGSAGTHPENTLASIGAALAAGADCIEIDVREVDGAILVLHDADLDRTTNGTGSVYAQPLAALRELDAGDGERIPLLGEVFDLIDARAGLNIEIKQTGLNTTLTGVIEHALARNPRWHNKVLISSFLPEPLQAFATTRPDGVLLGALSDHTGRATLEFAITIGAAALNLALGEVSAAIVDAAHARGLRVLVYTVNEPADIARCQALGVDGIFTDYPARTIAFLREQSII